MKLGPEYVVWDKTSSIRFKKPGLGTIRANFVITQQLVDTVRAEVDTSPLKKSEPELTADITDQHGVVIATVTKVLSIRKVDHAHKHKRHSHSQV